MGWWLLALIIVVFVCLWLTTVRIEVQYHRTGENDRIFLVFSAWYQLIRYPLEIPVMKVKASEEGAKLVAKVENEGAEHSESDKSIDATDMKRVFNKYRELVDKIHDFQPILRNFTRHVFCERLEWSTVLGIGEAAGTGTLTGLVYSIKSMIVGMFSHYISLRTIPRISVNPAWNNTIIRTQFHCILRFRVGHAIWAGIRLLWKTWKGRERKWQSTPFRV